MADADASLSRLYGVKTPLLPLAKRCTFVVGRERRILHVDTGSDALDPEGAIEACSLFGHDA